MTFWKVHLSFLCKDKRSQLGFKSTPYSQFMKTPKGRSFLRDSRPIQTARRHAVTFVNCCTTRYFHRHTEVKVKCPTVQTSLHTASFYLFSPERQRATQTQCLAWVGGWLDPALDHDSCHAQCQSGEAWGLVLTGLSGPAYVRAKHSKGTLDSKSGRNWRHEVTLQRNTPLQ